MRTEGWSGIPVLGEVRCLFRWSGMGFSQVHSPSCSAVVPVSCPVMLWSHSEGAGRHSVKSVLGALNGVTSSNHGEGSRWLGELSKLFYFLLGEGRIRWKDWVFMGGMFNESPNMIVGLYGCRTAKGGVCSELPWIVVQVQDGHQS